MTDDNSPENRSLQNEKSPLDVDLSDLTSSPAERSEMPPKITSGSANVKISNLGDYRPSDSNDLPSASAIELLDAGIDRAWQARVRSRLTLGEQLILRWCRHLSPEEVVVLSELSASKVIRTLNDRAAVFIWRIGDYGYERGSLLGLVPMSLLRETWHYVETHLGEPCSPHFMRRPIFMDISGGPVDFSRIMRSLRFAISNEPG